MSVSQFGGGGGGAGGTLPAGVNQSWLESQGGSTNVWQAAINEMLTGILVNATSTGDAGDRADHFLGGSLKAKWTVAGQALASSNVGYSVYTPVSNSVNLTSILQTYTPSGNCSVTSRVRRGMTSSSQVALVIGSSTFAVNPLAGDAVIARISDSSGAGGPNKYEIATVDAGVLTSRASSNGAAVDGFQWIYMSLQRAGNVWTASFSMDGAGLQQPTTTTKTMTAALVGFWVSLTPVGFSAIDFFDVLT